MKHKVIERLQCFFTFLISRIDKQKYTSMTLVLR